MVPLYVAVGAGVVALHAAGEDAAVGAGVVALYAAGEDAAVGAGVAPLCSGMHVVCCMSQDIGVSGITGREGLVRPIRVWYLRAAGWRTC